MKKKLLCISLLLLAFSISACGKQTENDVNETGQIEESFQKEDESESTEESMEGSESTDSTEVRFTDSLGREVTVSNPKRVITLLGSFCEEWLLAGGNVVGTASDTFTNYDFGFEDSVVDIGSHMEPNLEQIIALQPDFIIASNMTTAQVDILETLEAAGINVAYFCVNNFDDYLASLDIFTRITGRADLYEEYGTKVAEEIATAKSQIDGSKPTILFVRAAATNVKVKGSEGTVGGEILADLDTINIADSESLLEDLSMEAIIMADPEYIFVTTQGSKTEAALANVDELMVSNPAWNSLTAVKNGHYYVIDKALYNSKPNARWGEAYQLLADILYPQE